jgi:hypothetical protein
LNLLDAFGAFAPVREIAEKSFAFRSTRHQIDRLERRRESLLHSLNDRAGSVESRLTVDDFRGYERLSSVMQRLQSSIAAKCPSRPHCNAGPQRKTTFHHSKR